MHSSDEHWAAVAEADRYYTIIIAYHEQQCPAVHSSDEHWAAVADVLNWMPEQFGPPLYTDWFIENYPVPLL